MALKDELVCKICNMIVEDPVLLPCKCPIYICRVHLINRSESIECANCHVSFTPPVGFIVNTLAKSVLEAETYLDFYEKSLKLLINDMNNQLSQLSNAFNTKSIQIDTFCTEHFASVRVMIGHRRAEMINEINGGKFEDNARLTLK